MWLCEKLLSLQSVFFASLILQAMLLSPLSMEDSYCAFMLIDITSLIDLKVWFVHFTIVCPLSKTSSFPFLRDSLEDLCCLFSCLMIPTYFPLSSLKCVFTAKNEWILIIFEEFMLISLFITASGRIAGAKKMFKLQDWSNKGIWQYFFWWFL